jgi:short-subunit dehydrogenase
MFDFQNSTALVTGASSGIGKAISQALVGRGVPTIVLVARDEEGLTLVANDLRHQGVRAETVALDLTEADAPARLREATNKLGLQIDLLVNDAGTVTVGAFDQLRNRENQEITSADVVALNVAALVGLTEQYLPDMVARGRGGVLNMGSTAGFQPVPYSATYAASKAFVQSFSQALWTELHDRGHGQVRMVCISPGVTRTNLGSGNGEDRGLLNKVSVSMPAEIGQAAVEALDDNVPLRVIGVANKVQSKIFEFFPPTVAAGIIARFRRHLALEATGESAPAAPALPVGVRQAALPLAAALLVGVGLWRAIRR